MLEKSNFIQFFNDHFPSVTEENITKRTVNFYILFYILLFSIPMALKDFSLLNFTIIGLSLCFLAAHTLSFIISKQLPSFFRLINLFEGFKLFMFVYVTYLMFTLLLTIYLPNETTFLSILYFIGFGIFPTIILFYYISKAVKYARTKIKDVKNK